MKNILVVVDMQNDFIDGALGSPQAVSIVKDVVSYIRNNEWDDIFCTYDTHTGEESVETSRIPDHCIQDTDGWKLNERVYVAIKEKKNNDTYVEKFSKSTFACPELAKRLHNMEDATIYIVGLCTDICVISNALMLRAACPESEITVVENCCAGTSEYNHEAALAIAKANCINVESWSK